QMTKVRGFQDGIFFGERACTDTLGLLENIPGILTLTPFVAIIDDIMVNELQAVVQGLGGKQILGRALASEDDMRQAIREGFPPKVVEEVMRASGLTLKELATALDLSPRS